MIKFCILTYDNKSVETFDNDLNYTFCNADYKWVFHEISFKQAKEIAKKIHAESLYARFYNEENTCIDQVLVWCNQLSDAQNKLSMFLFRTMKKFHTICEE